MECEETIKDMRTTTDEERAVTRRNNQLMYEMDHTDPQSSRYQEILHELFAEIGEGSFVAPGLHGAAMGSVKIGKHVFINTAVDQIHPACSGLCAACCLVHPKGEQHSSCPQEIIPITGQENVYIFISCSWQ